MGLDCILWVVKAIQKHFNLVIYVLPCTCSFFLHQLLPFAH